MSKTQEEQWRRRLSDLEVKEGRAGLSKGERLEVTMIRDALKRGPAGALGDADVISRRKAGREAAEALVSLVAETLSGLDSGEAKGRFWLNLVDAYGYELRRAMCLPEPEPEMTREDALDWASRTTLPLGKRHADELICDVPRSYLEYLDDDPHALFRRMLRQYLAATRQGET